MRLHILYNKSATYMNFCGIFTIFFNEIRANLHSHKTEYPIWIRSTQIGMNGTEPTSPARSLFLTTGLFEITLGMYLGTLWARDPRIILDGWLD